jgi:signal transduction histidine kinase/ActR/RegA family two-component response regulator
MKSFFQSLMKRVLREASIRRKLLWTSLLTSGVSLLAVCLLLALYNYASQGAAIRRSLETESKVMAQYGPALLLLEDEKAAQELLNAHLLNPYLVAAGFYTSEGRLLAGVQQPNSPPLPALAQGLTEGVYQSGRRLTVVQPVMDQAGAKRIGLVVVQADDRQLRENLRRSFWITVVAAVGAFGLGYILFARLSRIIVEPVAELARATGRVAEAGDYSVRVQHQSEDEIGRLVDGFNAMLREIQARDVALAGARAELEERVARRTKELLEANEHLRGEMVQRAGLEEQLRQAQKMEAVGQLAGGVAHDFNNLLTVILGHVGLMRSAGLEEPDLVESAREIEAAAERARNLTRQLLAFSRRQVLTMRPVDLNEVLGNLAKMLQRLLGEHVALQVNYAPDLPSVQADVHSVEQVVINLAVNARDAMPQGGALIITTRVVRLDTTQLQQNPDAKPGRHVCLEVSDEGCGMDAATLQRIFEPFFTTKPPGKGTGLGLATAYGIVKQHLGWMEVASAVGKGTTFKVFLPAEAGRAAPSKAKAPQLRVAGGSETLLIVEDEDALRQFTVRWLRRHGYQVLEARDGPAALEIWAEKRASIQLVMTDLVMPGGMNGKELSERLLQDRPELPLIFTTGYSEEAMKGGLELREDFNYLPKPYLPAHLAKIIRENLDRAATQRDGGRPGPG